MKETFKPVYLLDSGTCEAILTRLKPDVMRRLVQCEVSAVAISSITHSELVFAANASRTDKRDRAALELMLRYVTVLDYPAFASNDYAEIREGLHWRRESMAANDILLTAHARCLGITLVTGRVREFRRVPRLLVESWGA